MLDQSFSAKNFRRIFDEENRKGTDLAAKFFPKVEEITKQIKELNFQLRNLGKTGLSGEELKAKRAETKQEILLARTQKEELLTEYLEQIAGGLNQNFRVRIEIDKSISSKPVYKLTKNAASYFVIKQIQRNINKLYKVKQSNRHEIVSQLYRLLDNDFPKYLIRTDIKEFYESIPQDKLMSIVDRDNLLSFISKEYIRGILKSYNLLSGLDKGIPRGIGLSAYLAELYMREFDTKVREDDEVIFYARYVDDIVVLYAPKPDSDPSNKLNKIKDIANQIELIINESDEKTFVCDLSSSKRFVFDYLGYQFRNVECWTEGKQHKKLKFGLDISAKKTKRYMHRINLSFHSYFNADKSKNKRAKELLIKRIRFLTSNTRLRNNKDNAYVGVFFTNNLITQNHRIDLLDRFLRSKTKQITLPSLRSRLEAMTFKEGFQNKVFHQHSVKSLIEIVKVWKYGT